MTGRQIFGYWQSAARNVDGKRVFHIPEDQDLLVDHVNAEQLDQTFQQFLSDHICN
ncbi:hypothetical protein X975_19355, partial [Stegodyphus mimosarum]